MLAALYLFWEQSKPSELDDPVKVECLPIMNTLFPLYLLHLTLAVDHTMHQTPRHMLSTAHKTLACLTLHLHRAETMVGKMS